MSFSTECILLWTKIPASCAGRDSGLLWGLFLPMGFSCSSKCRRVLPFPVASSKVRSRTSFFSLGIAAFAASRRSAALSDFRIYLSSSGVARSSSVNCKREDFFFCCGFCLCFPRRLFCSPFWYAPRRYAPRRARLRRCPVPVLPPAHGEVAACRLRAGKLRRPVGAALPVPAAAVLRSLQSPRPLSAC